MAPEWSNDGQKVAFLLYPNSYWPPLTNLSPFTNVMPGQFNSLHLQVMNADGSGKKTITNSSVSTFSWSPTEDKIAYCTNDFLAVINSDGSARKRITKPGQVTCSTISRLSWSPDGKTLAFSSFGPDEHRVVVLIGKNGKNARAVVKGYGAIWSPDGTKLLFLHDSETNPITTSICLANPDGSDPRKLLDNEAARFGLAWFPDGKSILFGSTRENKYQSEIFRLNVDGTGLKKIASVNASMLRTPTVSADGSKLLVNSYPTDNHGDPSYGWNVYLGTHDRRRVAKGNYGDLVWLE